MNTYVLEWSYLVQFFLEWILFQTEVVEKIMFYVGKFKIHFMFNVFFFLNHAVYENVEKYC